VVVHPKCAVRQYLLRPGTAISGQLQRALTRSDSLYFTVTVFSTVGFGDITPKTELARLLVTGQMVVDVIILGSQSRSSWAPCGQGDPGLAVRTARTTSPMQAGRIRVDLMKAAGHRPIPFIGLCRPAAAHPGRVVPSGEHGDGLPDR